MKYFLVALVFLFAPLAEAYNPITVDAEQPFEEIFIEANERGLQQSYLGSLEGYPEMFEFLVPEDTVLQLQVKQRAAKEPSLFNLILVSVHPDTGRIKEQLRVNSSLEDRVREFDWLLGVSLLKSEVEEIQVPAGLYRLEVSTPINEGNYELDFGIESNDNSYFGTFGTIWQVQRHYEYWWTQYLLSSFVFYQLGIVLMIGGFVYAWRKRKESDHDS